MIDEDENEVLEAAALAQARAQRDKRYCTPCARWVVPIRSTPHAPPMCPKCRSGRVRPAARGERVPD